MWRLFWLILRLAALLPFSVVYFFSDLSYFLVYYIFRYRREVVRENLEFSFKQKSRQEIIKIEKQFYHHFCDLLFESVKIVNMSPEEILRRMKYTNYEQMVAHYAEGKSVMLYTSHNGNWEWTSSFSLLLPKDKPVYQVYKAQKGAISNKIIAIIRTHFGAKNVEMNQLLRKMVTLRSEDKLGMFGIIGDQSPAKSSIHYYTDFLGQYTATISGTERLAKKFDYPVYYASVRKVKRGYYTCEFIPLAIQPGDTEEYEITEKYMRLLEKDILHDPSTWLWTHRRWKITRE